MNTGHVFNHYPASFILELNLVSSNAHSMSHWLRVCAYSRSTIYRDLGGRSDIRSSLTTADALSCERNHSSSEKSAAMSPDANSEMTHAEKRYQRLR